MREKSRTEAQTPTKYRTTYRTGKMDYVLKLGGSVLTEKKREKQLSENFSEILRRIENNPNGVIIHGAGSFGHPPAEKHGIASGSRQGILETHRAIKQLNTKIVDELRDSGVKAVPVHPLSMSLRNPDTEMMVDHVFQMLEEGFTPVLHGDGIVTEGKGFTVLSGDEILALIEKEAKTGNAGFCTSVKGVMDQKGEVLDEINSMSDFHEKKVEGTDVSGGMKNKLEEIFEKQIEAQIFGHGQLEKFLEGEKTGTQVKAR